MNMENNTTLLKFCKNLKELRSTSGMSQADVAKKLEIPTSTYANWEQGRREPSISDIYKILKCFDIDANTLFDLNDY